MTASTQPRIAPVPHHRLEEWLATPEGPPRGLPAAEVEHIISNQLDWIEWEKWLRAHGYRVPLLEAALEPNSIAAEVMWELERRGVL